jgi:hypothetical protein
MKADRQQTEDRTAAEKGLIDYNVSPEVADKKAAGAGKIRRAEAENASYDLSPGQERYIGDKRIAKSGSPTAAEIVDKQIREGVRPPPGAKAAKVVDPKKRSDFDKMFDPKRFADENGRTDYARMGLHKGLAEAFFDRTEDVSGSFALAGEVIDRATAAAQAAAKDDPKKFKPALEAEIARLAKKAGVTMPRNVFDDQTAAAATDDAAGAQRRTEELRTRTREAERRVAESNRQMGLSNEELAAENRARRERVAETEGEANVARRRTPVESEAPSLSIEQINRMSATEARQAYRRYYADLTPEQRRALKRRM